jgi:hypothetical protein
MIFENASIQTMIMLFKNNKTADNYTFDYRKLEGNKLVLEDVLNLLMGKRQIRHFFCQQSKRESLTDKSLTFNTDENLIC